MNEYIGTWRKHPCNTKLHYIVKQDDHDLMTACGFRIYVGNVANHRIKKRCKRCETIRSGTIQKIKSDDSTLAMFERAGLTEKWIW